MSFADIKDQQIPVRLLRNILRSHRVPNGLLFWGPEGVGKKTTAWEMAKAINCKAGEGDACDQCLSCRKVLHGSHPDVMTIVPKSRSRLIVVEEIEAVIEMCTYRPFEGGWRLVMIEEADRMNEKAQNKFLKTLEEPPSNTTFVLLTEQPKRMLPTIRSRCQGIRFGALHPATVAQLLEEKRKLAPDIAHAIAAVSQGQMSRAFDFVDSEKRTVVLDMTKRLGAGEDPLVLSVEFSRHIKESEEALKTRLKAEQPSTEHHDASREELDEAKDQLDALAAGLIRRELMEYLYLLAAWYRDELVFTSTGHVRAVLNRDQVDRLRAHPGAHHEKKVQAIELAWVYIERNLNRDRIFRDLFFALAS
jgi:DNA polymerase-3 subunit delta'